MKQRLIVEPQTVFAAPPPAGDDFADGEPVTVEERFVTMLGSSQVVVLEKNKTMIADATVRQLAALGARFRRASSPEAAALAFDAKRRDWLAPPPAPPPAPVPEAELVPSPEQCDAIVRRDPSAAQRSLERADYFRQLAYQRGAPHRPVELSWHAVRTHFAAALTAGDQLALAREGQRKMRNMAAEAHILRLDEQTRVATAGGVAPAFDPSSWIGLLGGRGVALLVDEAGRLRCRGRLNATDEDLLHRHRDTIVNYLQTACEV